MTADWNKFASIAVDYIANIVTIGLNGVTVGYFRMPMIARLIVFVSFTLFLCLNAGRAGALDLVNVVLAPLPPPSSLKAGHSAPLQVSSLKS